MTTNLLLKLIGAFFLLCISVILFSVNCFSKGKQSKSNISVIAYYTGDADSLRNYEIKNLSHIIYSFLHLKGNQLDFDNEGQKTTLRKLVALKKDYPNLKIIVSLGGWGGCETCSDVFSTKIGREVFSLSVKTLQMEYKIDGIDLDWEYPSIEGYPGHKYMKDDKHNFTLLLMELRKTLGNNFEISFAAGGYSDYFLNSIEWEKVVPLIDKINLMSYDLTNGYSKLTGHHTPLYSSKNMLESVDRGVKVLNSMGVPMNKIIIGAAFYARVWENVDSTNNGLYQNGVFKTTVPYNEFSSYFKNEFFYHWDTICHAPFYYNKQDKLFATFDDNRSIALKTQYAIKNNLGGIMFWELSGDKKKNGLLEAINLSRNAYK